MRSHEVPLGATAGVSPDEVIPLNELVVGIVKNRFYVRWPAADKRVRFSSGHMLNLHTAPPVGRFLVDLSLDSKAIFSSFDWGSVEIFPYLPRVQAGRIVLRPAQWRIHKDDITIETNTAYRLSLDRWRAEWDVPRHIFLTIGDNRLVLDLDQDAQAAELKVELQKLPVGGSVIVQEVLPGFDRRGCLVRADITTVSSSSPLFCVATSCRQPSPQLRVLKERLQLPLLLLARRSTLSIN